MVVFTLIKTHQNNLKQLELRVLMIMKLDFKLFNLKRIKSIENSRELIG